MIRPDEVLSAAADHMQNRASTYDSPGGERSMAKTVDMFNILKGDDCFTTELGWMFMGILKMVRSQQGEFKLDNYEDLAAYAALAAEAGAMERSPPHSGPRLGEATYIDPYIDPD